MLRRSLRTFVITATAAVTLAASLYSCGLFGSTQIGDIITNPRKYSGSEVTVSGEVTEVFSIVFMKYFIIRDKTGEITVITERPLPAKGEAIKVTGTVKEAFSLGSRTLLVIVESPKKQG
jgi:hypothetical protein